MDFNFTEEQDMLRASARDFLKKECHPELVRGLLDDETGYSEKLWKKMADLGWMGITLHLEYGGTSNSFLDLVILQEEMGRFLMLSPFLSTILAGRAVSAVGSEKQNVVALTENAQLGFAFRDPVIAPDGH